MKKTSLVLSLLLILFAGGLWAEETQKDKKIIVFKSLEATASAIVKAAVLEVKYGYKCKYHDIFWTKCYTKSNELAVIILGDESVAFECISFNGCNSSGEEVAKEIEKRLSLKMITYYYTNDFGKTFRYFGACDQEGSQIMIADVELTKEVVISREPLIYSCEKLNQIDKNEGLDFG